MVPVTKPVTVTVLVFVGGPIVGVEAGTALTRLQLPDPTVGAVAVKVTEVWSHIAWSAPALAVVGGSKTRIFT